MVGHISCCFSRELSSLPDGMLPITYGTTMDNELIYELFNNVVAASNVLSEDSDLAKHY